MKACIAYTRHLSEACLQCLNTACLFWEFAPDLHCLNNRNAWERVKLSGEVHRGCYIILGTVSEAWEVSEGTCVYYMNRCIAANYSYPQPLLLEVCSRYTLRFRLAWHQTRYVDVTWTHEASFTMWSYPISANMKGVYPISAAAHKHEGSVRHQCSSAQTWRECIPSVQ